MASTRLSIIQRIADAMNLRLTGYPTTAPATSAVSVIDNVRRYEQDDYCNEGFFLATSSGGTVCENRISDFANGTQTITLYSGLSTSLTTTVAYDILLPPITPDQYRAAIKAAASKFTARGIGRRTLDTTVRTTLARRYALPSTLDVALTEAYIQGEEFTNNNTWLDSTGWTLHASASLTNDGANAERTLKLIATAANEHSYDVIDVTPNTLLEFFASVKSDGTRSARWQVQIYDQDGTIISAYSTIGSAVTVATWTEVTGLIRVPSNGTRLRIAFNSDAAGTVYTQAPCLMRYGDWERLSGWKVEYDGATGYVLLPGQPQEARRLKLVGQRTLESLSADTDTLSLDEPEIAAFTELCCAEAWRMYGSRLGMSASAVQQEADTHEKEYAKLIGRLSGEWRKLRHARLPQWGAS